MKGLHHYHVLVSPAFVQNEVPSWGSISKKKKKNNQTNKKTRWFSNQEFRLLSRSHTFAIIGISDLTHTKTWTKGHWPQMTFDPKSVEVACVTLPKDHCVQVPWKYINVDTVTFFSKSKTKGHWPLDDLWPQVCWSHVWLYPRIIVSKSHENTSKYVDTTFFQKLNPKVIDP